MMKLALLTLALLSSGVHASQIDIAWTAGFGDASAREATAKAGDTLEFSWR